MFVKLKRYGKLYDYIQSLPSVYGISDVLSGITFDLIENEKYYEAIMCYEKLLELNPSDISSITEIKRIWDKAGMKEEKRNSKYNSG